MPVLKIDSLSNVNDDDIFRNFFALPIYGAVLIKHNSVCIRIADSCLQSNYTCCSKKII